MQASALRSLAAIVALYLSFSASGADEVGATVAKPQVKVGDRWTYRRTDYLTNKVSFTYENRVASTGPDEILIVSKRRGWEIETDTYHTSEWNAIAAGGRAFIPHTGYFKFPLKVGASSKAEFETANKGSPARSNVEYAIRVVGWEDITVPAGKFRALKIEGKGGYMLLHSRGGGWLQIEFWYVPEIKRWVKETYAEGAGQVTLPSITYGDELLEFSVQ